MSATSYNLLVPGEKIQSDMLTFSADTKQDLFNELGKAVLAIQSDPAYLPKISYQNHIQSPHKFAVSINVDSFLCRLFVQLPALEVVPRIV